MRLFATLALFALLGACVSAPNVVLPQPPPPRPQPDVAPSEPAPPPAAGFRAPQIMQGGGVDGVIRASAARLSDQFGPPRLDVVEGDARKLQFAGTACVLDVYLYPLREGEEPQATWVQARRASDGREVDKAACVAALRRR